MLEKKPLPPHHPIWNNWVVDYANIIDSEREFFAYYMETYPGFLAKVDLQCALYLLRNFREEITRGMAANWESVFSLGKEWIVKHHAEYGEWLKPHFIRRPGLWFYLFRYDVKKIHPRTGEVDKELASAWAVMDAWGIEHGHAAKVDGTWKIQDK